MHAKVGVRRRKSGHTNRKGHCSLCSVVVTGDRQFRVLWLQMSRRLLCYVFMSAMLLAHKSVYSLSTGDLVPLMKLYCFQGAPIYLKTILVRDGEHIYPPSTHPPYIMKKQTHHKLTSEHAGMVHMIKTEGFIRLFLTKRTGNMNKAIVMT